LTGESCIVRLRGGLGNQLFQYAFAKYLQQNFYNKVYLDKSPIELANVSRRFVLDAFQLDDKLQVIDCSGKIWSKVVDHKSNIVRRAGKAFLKAFTSNFFFEGYKLYDKEQLINQVERQTTGVFDGYWQNVFYVQDVAGDLMRDLEFKPSLLARFVSENKELLEAYDSYRKVCLHVRRSDFLNSKSIHVSYGAEYYSNAYATMPKKEKQAVFIFSDDIEWCRKNLQFIKSEIVFVDKGVLKGNSDVDEFMLMTLCDDFIIPNSTFSWWAAWLSKAENKTVICPSKWLRIKQPNIIPAEWITIN
jgi:hypothetical protein